MAVSVLVVDSDRMLVDLLAHELQSKTVVVSGFTTVSEALLLLEDVQPEVVLLNPEMDSGPDLLAELRRSWPGSAIVLLKTSSDKDPLEAGIAVFLKDQPFEQLLGIIRELIGTAL